MADFPDTEWSAYLDAERVRIRSESAATLEAFLEALLQRQRPLWTAWALEFVARRERADGGEVPIRMPLFRRVLFPALREAFEAKKPGAARLLAGLAQYLYKSPEFAAQLPADARTEHGLLLHAVAHDSGDLQARRRLAEVLQGNLEYALHELPAGVLYGHDGATADECLELLAMLETFDGHITALGIRQAHEELISDCAFHFRAYREYLLAGRPGGSYEQHLSEAAGAGADPVGDGT